MGEHTMEIRTDVVVVGGGLAGLTAARLLQAAGTTTLVVEPHVVGGRGRTDGRHGFLFNRGPHALYLGGAARRVFDQLGVPIAGGAPGSDAFGLRGDTMGVLPAGAGSLARTLGFLAVLERLGPVERAVFLLADVFREPFAAIAPVVGRSEEACRQIASRARRRVREERHSLRPTPVNSDELVDAFMAACALGDIEQLRRVLTDDVVLVSDGGRDVHAARRPVLGFDRVSRLLASLTRRLPEDLDMERHEVNGEPGLVFARNGVVWLVMVFEQHADRFVALRLVLNPEKLRHVGLNAAS